MHHDPRLREQEFGNLQGPGLAGKSRAEEELVGRFYYRRPNAESSADVYDRIQAFWEALVSPGPTSLLLSRTQRYHTAVLVSHGLTLRLLLMAVFHWSVTTFHTVFNLGNCEHIVLQKNSSGAVGYRIAPELSHPPRLPWATHVVWLRFKNLQPKPETLQKLERLQALRANFAAAAGGGGGGGGGSGVGGSSSSSSGSSGDAHNSSGVRRSSGAASSDGGGGGGSGELAWAELDAMEDTLLAQADMERSLPFTVVDYLSLEPPRSMQHDEVLRCRLVPGARPRGRPEELLLLAAELGAARVRMQAEAEEAEQKKGDDCDDDDDNDKRNDVGHNDNFQSSVSTGDVAAVTGAAAAAAVAPVLGVVASPGGLAVGTAAEGYFLNLQVEALDWWGPGLSHAAKTQRIAMDRKQLVAKDLDVSAGGRDSRLVSPAPPAAGVRKTVGAVRKK